MKLVIAGSCIIAAWFCIDLVNEAPHHALFDFLDMRTIGGVFAMIFSMMGYEMIRQHWTDR